MAKITIQEAANRTGKTAKTIWNLSSKLSAKDKKKYVSKNEQNVTIIEESIVYEKYPRIGTENEELERLKKELAQCKQDNKYLKEELSKAHNILATESQNKVLENMKSLGLTKEDLNRLPTNDVDFKEE